MVVDRQAWHLATRLLRDFIAGKVGNFDFERRCPENGDRAIQAIWDTCWLFYDDFHAHKRAGRNKLEVTTKRLIVRWNVFLHGDHDCLWPHLSLPGAKPSLPVGQSRLKRFFWPSGLDGSEVNTFLQAGHYSV